MLRKIHFKCEMCLANNSNNQTYPTEESLNSHLHSHKIWKCSRCEK